MIPLKSGLLALQKAFFVRLQAVLHPIPVFDQVPDNTPIGYAVIGEDTANRFDTKTVRGQEITVTVQFFSRYPGFSELKTMMDTAISGISTLAPDPAIDGFKIVSNEVDFAETFREDGQTRRGVVRFRFIIL